MVFLPLLETGELLGRVFLGGGERSLFGTRSRPLAGQFSLVRIYSGTLFYPLAGISVGQVTLSSIIQGLLFCRRLLIVITICKATMGSRALGEKRLAGSDRGVGCIGIV